MKNNIRIKPILIFMLLIMFFLCSCKSEESKTNKILLDYNMSNMTNEEVILDENNNKFVLPVPNAIGYKFLGWENEKKEIVTEILFNASISEIYLKANWERTNEKKYSLSYVLNGGTALGELKEGYLEGEEYVFPNLASDKLEFFGWYLTPDFTGERIFSTAGKGEDLVLYAKFSNPKINYVMDDGYFIEEVKYEYTIGDTYKLPIPEREDYLFIDWYLTPDLTGEPVREITKEMNQTITLYAKWEYLFIVRTINYLLKGGKLVGEAPKTYDEGKGCKLPEAVRDGYIFLGWLDSDLDRIVTEINTRGRGDKVLIAQWEKIYDYSQIHYVLNGGFFEGEYPKKYPETVGIDLVIPKKEGYFFRGFYYSNNFSSEKITRINGKQTGDVTVYAKWEEATLENANISFYGDSITTFDGYIPEGYAFYYPTASATVKSVEDTWWYQTLKNTNSKLLVNNSYGGTSVHGGKNQGVDEERIKLLSTDTTRPDIIIVYLGINDVVNKRATTVFKDAYTKMVQSIQKIYPESKLFLCTLCYETYSNESVPGLRDAYNEVIETVGNKYDCEIINFDKVFTVDKGLSHLGDRIHPNKKGMDLLATEATKALKEYYNELSGYSINYDLNGGKMESENYLSVYKNLKVNYRLPKPVKEGYKFVGWFDSESNKVEYISPNDKKDISVIAMWEKIENTTETYEVRVIDGNGLESVKYVKYGECLEKLNTISKNYIWIEGLKAFDFAKPITSNTTIREVWVGVYEILSENFKENVFDDLKMLKKYETSIGSINVEWTSSNSYVIDPATGRVNPSRNEIDVNLMGKFTYYNKTISYEFKVTVDKIEFKSLANIKPTFAYIYTNTADLIIDNLTISTIDVANYGFARVTTTSEVSIGELTNLNNVLKLRKYGIRVLLCIGGYEKEGKNFSDAASTKEGREKLAKSIANTIEKYGFDGVDIDWEYPGFGTGRDTTIDRPNYTLLMEEINKEVKAKNNDYIVSAALPGGIYSYPRYELNKLDAVMDYVHLMTYDLASSSKVTHHTPVYDGDYTPSGSVEQTVKVYASAGIPKRKLIVGIAFYGRVFQVSGDVTTILGNENIINGNSSITFTNIYSNYLEKSYSSNSNIHKYFDEKSKAPYIYDSTNKVIITYDNKESIKEKLDYVKNNELGGVMFWDYGEDLHGILLNAIYENK